MSIVLGSLSKLKISHIYLGKTKWLFAQEEPLHIIGHYFKMAKNSFVVEDCLDPGDASSKNSAKG